MKRVLIAISLCLVLVIAFAAPALAAPKGAVKADMVIHTDSSGYGAPGTVVGSVILNTTGSGYLIVVVNLDDASVDGNLYDSVVVINGENLKNHGGVVEDILCVNGQGQASANYKVDLNALPVECDVDLAEDTSIDVRVIVRPDFVSSPKATPCYVNGPSWPTEITVPLK